MYSRNAIHSIMRHGPVFSLTALIPADYSLNLDLLQADFGCSLVSGAGSWDQKREIRLEQEHWDDCPRWGQCQR